MHCACSKMGTVDGYAWSLSARAYTHCSKVGAACHVWLHGGLGTLVSFAPLPAYTEHQQPFNRHVPALLIVSSHHDSSTILQCTLTALEPAATGKWQLTPKHQLR